MAYFTKKLLLFVIVTILNIINNGESQTLSQQQEPQQDQQNTYDNYQSTRYGQQLPTGILQQQQQQQQLQRPYQQQQSQQQYNNDIQGSNYNNYDNQVNNPTTMRNPAYNYNTYGRGNTNYYANSGGTNYYYDGIDENSFCPEHWVAHRQICYRFVRSPKRNWFEAKKICKAYNSDLINIDSIDKHSFIMKELILQNQKHNRYLISARQTAPGQWINDDNSQFLFIDDSFAYEDVSNENENLHDNRYLSERDRYNSYYGKDFNNFNDNTYGPNKNPNDLSNRYNNQTLQQYSKKDRLVYGFSTKRDKWMFIPVFETESNLFICESKQLYNPDNINILVDEKRKFDYGLEYSDLEKIPRGPYFVKQPKDIIYDTSKKRLINDITLSCLAAGYPTPTYEWFKEEYVNDSLKYFPIDPLIGDRYTVSGGNLIIYDPKQTTDQGVYHCVAKNKFGKVRSESAQLNFGYIMEFNLKRSPETSEMNWGKSLFCDPPQHYPRVKYYWSREYFPNFVQEDKRVFVSDDGALYFSSIEITDRANYSCTVQSLVSDTGRNGPFFPLRVYPNNDYQVLIFANAFPKVFPEAPIAGEEVRLECVAFGYPIPSYNWTRKNAPLPRNSYQTSYNRVLIIPNATINDNGEYTCTIENNRKTLSKSIFINIQMRPNFTIPLRDKVKDYNSEVSFVCEAFAVPDVNYTWYKNAKLLEIEKLDRDRYTIQDNVLTIKYLDPEKDDGMYQCRAENQLKAVFSSAQLRVLTMRPSFKKRPLEPEIYAIYNGNTTIVCDPEAAPRPRFQWKKDGNVIGSGGHRRILPSGTLIISPTSRDDEGVYTCVATNSGGTDESKSRLIVLQELRFTQTLPMRYKTQVHQYIYLQCDAVYDEILDVAFIWVHNGQVIKDLEDPRIKINHNALTIYNVTMLDSGEYECKVKSAVNEISSKTIVTIEGPPGAPGGVSVIDIGKTKAVIEWVDGTDNGRPILFYNILGRTNWNKTWTNVSTQVRAHDVDRYTSRKQAEIVNLTPWSGYEFSVCAVNDLGVGTPSAPSPVYSTLEDVPYIAPRNVGGGGGKIGDLTITWMPLLPQEQNSHGIHYKIFWRLHGKEIEWSPKLLKEHGNVGKAVVNIPFENYYTQYDVKVQAINDIGKGPESQEVTIYSAEDMPQVAPQQPIARSYNSTALNVTWQPIEQTREKLRGKLIGHRIKYWKRDYREEDAVYYLSRTTRPWALIVGLEPDTFYHVKVMAYNAAGEGPESERYLERTYRKAPQKPPSSVEIKPVNPSTIRVTWRYISPSYEEEPLIGYKVRVWESDQDMSTANDTIVLVGHKLEAFVTNLTPGKSYSMRVLAYSNGGDGRMSSPALLFQMGDTKARNTGSSILMNRNILLGLLSIFYIYQMVIF